MHQDDIVAKTAEGAEELKSRTHKLPPRLRSMLIMADGTRTVGDLKKAAATIGAPDGFLDELLSHGLVAVKARAAGATKQAATVDIPVEANADRFREAQQFMNATVVDALGFRAMMFTLKLEKCFTLDDLRALLPEYTKVVTKGSGDGVARVLARRARDMLG